MIVAGAIPGAGWSHEGTTYLAIDVRNEGDLPASDVQIQVQRNRDGAEIRRTSIDYLAGGETSRIYVAVPGPMPTFGAGDGARRELRVLVAGFKEP